MPADGKKEFKINLKADPLKEMNKKAKSFIEGEKVIKKIFEPITYTDKVELDPRKWKQKDLDDGVYAVARYPIMQLCVRALELIEKAEFKFNPKLALALAKEYKEVAKEVEDKVSLAVEELAKDTGDSKKQVKELKKGLVGLEEVDSESVFAKPRKSLIGAMEDLAKEFSKFSGGGSSGGRPSRGAKDPFDEAMEKGEFADALSSAKKVVEDANWDFGKNGKVAQSAIDAMVKLASNVKKDKETPAPLQDLSGEILKGERGFAKFIDDSKTFETEIANILTSVKGLSMKRDYPSAMAKKLGTMSSLDKSADAIIKEAKTWSGKLGKIEKDLK